MVVFNFAAASLIRMLRRFKDELIASQSANQQMIMDADLKRLKNYQVAFKQAIDNYYSMNVLDFPKSSPYSIELPARPVYATVENPSVNDLVHLYSRMEVELAEGQSARLASGMVSHDYERAVAHLKAVDLMIDNYIIPYTPLDLPETSFKHAAQPNIPGAGTGTIASPRS